MGLGVYAVFGGIVEVVFLAGLVFFEVLDEVVMWIVTFVWVVETEEEDAGSADSHAPANGFDGDFFDDSPTPCADAFARVANAGVFVDAVVVIVTGEDQGWGNFLEKVTAEFVGEDVGILVPGSEGDSTAMQFGLAEGSTWRIWASIQRNMG